MQFIPQGSRGITLGRRPESQVPFLGLGTHACLGDEVSGLPCAQFYILFHFLFALLIDSGQKNLDATSNVHKLRELGKERLGPRAAFALQRTVDLRRAGGFGPGVGTGFLTPNNVKEPFAGCFLVFAVESDLLALQTRCRKTVSNRVVELLSGLVTEIGRTVRIHGFGVLFIAPPGATFRQCFVQGFREFLVKHFSCPITGSEKRITPPDRANNAHGGLAGWESRCRSCSIVAG